MGTNFKFCVLALVCAALTWLLSALYAATNNAGPWSQTLLASDFAWVYRLLQNLLGYAAVLAPGYLVYKYLHSSRYFDKLTNPTTLSRLLFALFGNPGERLPDGPAAGAGAGGAGAGAGAGREAVELAFCFGGLMGTYLVWGLLQEKIMTQSYSFPDGSARRFTDSQFLVFVNRASACAIAALALCARRAPGAPAPLYRLAYCSLSNVLSAWCQYEALKYVSFPTQVLSKSCKIIPVMLMGRAVSGSSYPPHEYASAGAVSLGMVLFMLGAKDHVAVSTVMTVSGVMLLALYMLCDSFTSSWQGRLFKEYRLTPLQMMCGVNLFSCVLTGAALLQSDQTPASVALLQHPMFLWDLMLISGSSALGQLLIYRTIAAFGPVVFTLIMTLRQAVSIVLSCLVFGHAVSWWGWAGAALVFAAALLRVYCRQRVARRAAV